MRQMAGQQRQRNKRRGQDEAVARVGEVMSTCLVTINKRQALAAAHAAMRVHGIRHLPVLERGRLVGIVSQRDLHLIETLRDVDPAQVTVEEAMTAKPFRVSPDSALADVARHMALHRLGSAIVVDAQERIVGLFTATDALAVLADMLDGS